MELMESDYEEYQYDGHRNLREETLCFNLTPEPMEDLSEMVEPEPSKDLTAVERDPSKIAKAFLEDVPVETSDLHLTEPREKDSLDPEQNNSTTGQETGNQPEEDLNNVHPSTQPSREGRGNPSVMDKTDIQTESNCSSRPIMDRKATKTLSYPELGNPLVTIVQSFQALSDVFTDSFEEPSKPPKKALELWILGKEGRM